MKRKAKTIIAGIVALAVSQGAMADDIKVALLLSQHPISMKMKVF